MYKILSKNKIKVDITYPGLGSVAWEKFPAVEDS